MAFQYLGTLTNQISEILQSQELYHAGASVENFLLGQKDK
jgi:hypothetical protein